MTLNVTSIQIDMDDGLSINIETGRVARQANGSVILKCGNCMLLATVVASKDAKSNIDFLPLSVDYQEKYAASGKIPGGFLKRESKLSDYEVLISRIIDRALRPTFPKDYHADVQVVVSLISADKNIMPDSLAALAASAALCISDIPFREPISEVRVVRHNGNFIVNPAIDILKDADINIMVAASKTDIIMIEGQMQECSEQELIEAIKFGHEAIKKQIDGINELVAKIGKAKQQYCHEINNIELQSLMTASLSSNIGGIIQRGLSKKERVELLTDLKNSFIHELPDKHRIEVNDETLSLVNVYFHDLEKSEMRKILLSEGKRLDGRQPTEIRNIDIEIDYVPSAHGSALFTRGETQSLTTVTLGSKSDEQLIDGVMFEGYNKFILHYNFPAFSTGEIRPNRAPGRREVGHGDLAMRSLKQVLPKDNIYTMRVVSDILESNGSSSMATVCAGSLALMDAGIKIKSAVSGIAMGLIKDASSDKYVVLSDILGDEDHLGDLDFKVTGTQTGICACQMDVKINGLSYEILEKSLQQAKQGRLHILNKMNETIETPNNDYKPHAPRIHEIEIAPKLIGAIIGPQGKVIQELQRETNTHINVEERDNKGIVQISSNNKEDLQRAIDKINGIVSQPEVNAVYDAVVKSVMPYGAFVEFLPNRSGLLHISEIQWSHVDKLEHVLKVGDTIKVKLIDIDKKTNKFRLSAKVLLPKPDNN
ncbi:MAG: polyribonucleotide nucleotidyltransferase [Solitalea-like symbiont of Tyrophagus putrescentiae]